MNKLDTNINNSCAPINPAQILEFIPTLVKSVGNTTISVFEQLSASNASANKIYMGSFFVLTGSAGIAYSKVLNPLKGYFSNKPSTDKINYALAGVSLTQITAGACLLYSGMSELCTPTPKTSNNMCETDVNFCKGNLGIPRAEMPQIEGETVVDRYLGQFSKSGIQVEHIKANADQLFATQNELNTQKVMGMVNAAKEGKFDPCKAEVIASGLDHHILDGHHRWAACKLLGGEMSVTSIAAPIQQLLESAKSVTGIAYRQFSV